MLFSLTPTRRRVLRLGAVASFIGAFIACGNAASLSDKVLHVTVTPAAAGLQTPLDATPDPMGTQIYFIATGAGGPGVFQVPAAGGTISTLHTGAPLVSPQGISVSSDGHTLYVADPAAGSDGKGVIFAMPSSGDTPMPLSGSAGTRPSALDIALSDTVDTIYFTGQDATGTPTIYEIPAAGGASTTVLAGAPLAAPGGIAVGPDDTVYVSDTQGGVSLPGQVFAVKAGKAAKLGPELMPGSPAGIAVTLDGARLLVSSLDSKAGTSQVELILTNNASYVAYDNVIKENTVSGGVHRARFQDVYAWAGKTQVYSILVKPIQLSSSTIGGVGVN